METVTLFAPLWNAPTFTRSTVARLLIAAALLGTDASHADTAVVGVPGIQGEQATKATAATAVTALPTSAPTPAPVHVALQSTPVLGGSPTATPVAPTTRMQRNEEVDLPKPGVAEALLAGLLVILLIGKRRAPKN